MKPECSSNQTLYMYYVYVQYIMSISEMHGVLSKILTPSSNCQVKAELYGRTNFTSLTRKHGMMCFMAFGIRLIMVVGISYKKKTSSKI